MKQMAVRYLSLIYRVNLFSTSFSQEKMSGKSW
uniref:Uncharacterized protein n=1 Tax=Rhizophora mucronata TaxID=61149 RepID=A0A2P2PA12_RHIMU